jgi:hypothetical protein
MKPSDPIERRRAEPIECDRAVIWAFVAFVAVIAGAVLYHQFAPNVNIIRVELGGRAKAADLPSADVIRRAMGWDLVLILGYGSWLLITTSLGRRVFTERAKKFARAASWLAVVTVVADVVEDACLFATTVSSRPSFLSRDGLLDTAATFSVLKFCCLLPAAAVAVAAIAVTWFRAGGWWRPKADEPHWPGDVEVESARPIEDDPATGSTGQADDGCGSARWRRGYLVPGLTAEKVAERASKGMVRGICLSGGGIRSGSVALGAMQVLRPELLSADYLISVSGGGYTAGALQLALTNAGTAPTGTGEGLRGATVLRDPWSVLMPGSVEEDRFRRHASYIANSTAETFTALGVLARGVVLSLGVLFGPALVLGVVAGLLYDAVPMMDLSKVDPASKQTVEFPVIPTTRWVAVAVLFAVALVLYVLFLADNNYSHRHGTQLRKIATGVTGVALLVATLAIAIPSLVFGSAWLLAKGHVNNVAFGGTFGSLLLAYGATVVSFGRRPKVKKGLSGLFGKKAKGAATSPMAAVPAGLLQLLLVVVTLVVLGAGWLLLFGGAAASTHGSGNMVVAACLVALLLFIFGGLLDQTSLSLHPFYRRRLVAAFDARRLKRSDKYVVAAGYPYAERTKLSEYGKRVHTRDGTFPEVVFAAAANLTGEQRAPWNVVGYTFNANWVGGPDIGYVRTDHLENVVQEQFKRDFTVQAAVAISGAAVATAMGRSGRWFGALLALTGARLGAWLPNPTFVGFWAAAAPPRKERGGPAAANARRDWTVPDLPRLRRLPYLVREVFGIHRNDDRLLQITDGGHYENLGLVELFRRRCTHIYCIDSSGDSPPTAGTLASAISLAFEELGVVVELKQEAWKLVSGSAVPLEPKDPLSALNARLSQQATLSATFTYPEESGLGTDPKRRTGTLVIAKALLTRDMDYDVLSYAARNEVFPHDSTGDQFFDDDKYCAYTALGREIGKQARAASARLGAASCRPSFRIGSWRRRASE